MGLGIPVNAKLTKQDRERADAMIDILGGIRNFLYRLENESELVVTINLRPRKNKWKDDIQKKT